METPRPSRDTVATVLLRGLQAWHEEGAGAQGTQGQLEGSPGARGAAFLSGKQNGHPEWGNMGHHTSHSNFQW